MIRVGCSGVLTMGRSPKFFVGLAVILAATDGSAATEGWRSKVDPWVTATAAGGAMTEFLVVLAEQADLSGAAHLPTKEAKGRYVFARLREVAARTQPAVLAELAARGVEFRAYWVTNLIWVRGDLGTVAAMAARPDVARVSANPRVALDGPVGEGGDPRSSSAVLGVEASIAHVGAPDLWAAGFTGQRVVVAGADTGVTWAHAALQPHYRGWNGATADHNHNWHDAIHSGGGICGADSAVPCDDHVSSHGTHTMGTMVGDDGGGNQIGMAPGAKWIGCRNMDQGDGTPATYTECFQFFLAPTDLADENPDPALAPDVVNNSWGCPPSEGCTDPDVLRMVVESLRAAGIAVVVSAGNSGAGGCSTVNTPAAIYDASITIGATDNFDTIIGFSSRGPVTVDGSNRLKPDLVAPGWNIRSSTRTGYGTLSGTSMASPHVAGLVALVLSAAPCLEGDVDAVEAYLIATAVPRTSSQGCGGSGPADVPNPTYGWGAIRAVFPAVCPEIFTDGFESGDTSAWSATVP